MKILQLCNKIPYPPNDGGAIAILNLALALADKENDVWIMAMSTQKHRINTEEIPTELSSRIHFIYIPTNTRINPFRLVLNLLFSKQPYNATRFYQKHFANKLRELLVREKFDLVQLEGLYLKSYLKLIRSNHLGKIAYRAHNIESDIWRGVAKIQKNLLKKYYLKLLAKRLRNYELDFINQYDLLLPITEDDQVKFNAFGNTKPSHVTYTGIPEGNFRTKKEAASIKDLFFIGALDWIPNQEGLIWFLEKVWRTLKLENPSLEFHIAGRNAPEWMDQKCREEKAVFHGEVSSAHQFLDNHDIMIVPLFAGSGLRIKIIEAMARSRVIITTRTGAKGLPAIKDGEIIIEDRPEKWIEHIQILLTDSEMYKSMSDQAYGYAKQNFSSESIINKLLYFCTQQGL